MAAKDPGPYGAGVLLCEGIFTLKEINDRNFIMNRPLTRILILAAVFIGAVIFFSAATSQVSDDLTGRIAEPTLPVVSFYNGPSRINELYGYTSEMEPTKVRDSIIPVGADHKLTCQIGTYGTDIEDIHYEIRSLDGENLISSEQIENNSGAGSSFQAILNISSILEEDVEYLMTLSLKANGGEVTYYSRIMYTTDRYVTSTLAFAEEFHDYTYREDASNFLPMYMEAKAEEGGTLQHVSLNSSLTQLTWGDMEITEVTEPVPAFKEINSSYNVITMDYVVSSINEDGRTEYYNVSEYFRLRQTEVRIYVLNYERTMNRIFRGEDDILSDSGNLLLGIRDNDVSYVANDAGTTVAFVQEGDLWCYDAEKATIARVFSFRGLEGTDIRENRTEHDIRIVDLDENNNIDFVVYGYMNCGDHEGNVGTAVYHYDSETHTVEELAYLPANASYEILKAQMGQLIYENSNRSLYLLRQGAVCELNLETLHMQTFVDEIQDHAYTVSESNRFVAWAKEEETYGNTCLRLLDLENGSLFDIRSENGMYIYPLAFMGEDFIYGTASKDDIIIDKTGIVTIPMRKIEIMDMLSEDHAVVKAYSPMIGYIQGIEIQEASIQVKLLKKLDGQYVSAGTDAIVNREVNLSSAVEVGSVTKGSRLRTVQLVLHAGKQKGDCRMIASSVVRCEAEPLVSAENAAEDSDYYVYAKGEVLLITENLSDAIISANESMGVVITADMQYIWMRARRSYVNPPKSLSVKDINKDGTSAEQALASMLLLENVSLSVHTRTAAGMSFLDIMKEGLPDLQLLELKGVRSDDVLYFVSKGASVLAMTGTDSAVLITGYSSGEVYCFDPEDGKTKTLTTEKADELFYGGGYRYLTYVK